MNTLLSSFHYYALALGFSGLLIRLLGLKDRKASTGSLQRVFLGDNLWGVAAILWLATGLLRAFGGYEKGTDYYLSSHWFILKMGLFGAIFLFEIYPMVTLIRWRISKLSQTSSAHAKAIALMYKITVLEFIFLSLIPFSASLMARGGFF